MNFVWALIHQKTKPPCSEWDCNIKTFILCAIISSISEIHGGWENKKFLKNVEANVFASQAGSVHFTLTMKINLGFPAKVLWRYL